MCSNTHSPHHYRFGVRLLYWFFCVFSSDDLDRKLQAQTTAEILANATNPIVMLSYITNRHGSRDYRTIVDGGNVKVGQT